MGSRTVQYTSSKAMKSGRNKSHGPLQGNSISKKASRKLSATLRTVAGRFIT